MVFLICLRLVVSYCPVVPRYDFKHLAFMEIHTHGKKTSNI